VLRPGRRNARRKTDASEDSILKAQLDAKDDSQNQQELMNENRELQEENRRKQLELEQARQQLQQLQSQQQQTQHPQLQDISQLQNQASWDVTAFLDQRSPTFSDPNMNTYQQGFPSPGIPTPPSDTSAYDQFFPSTGISSHSRSTSLNFSPPNGMLSPETVNGYMNQMNFSGFSNEADNMLNATAFSQDFSDDLAAATSQVHLWSDASPDQRMDPSAQYFDDMAPYYGGFG
jgi:flagellar biosynthesis GTPase FlhF